MFVKKPLIEYWTGQLRQDQLLPAATSFEEVFSFLRHNMLNVTCFDEIQCCLLGFFQSGIYEDKPSAFLSC